MHVITEEFFLIQWKEKTGIFAKIVFSLFCYDEEEGKTGSGQKGGGGMEDREEILKKVEKLLALAGNNPNEHEAVAAALKAQELMARYNIELADVQGKSAAQKITPETYKSKNGKNLGKWKYTLSGIIAKNFCCKTYTVDSDAVVFYGHENDAKIAKEVFRFLFESGNKFAERYYRKCREEGRNTKGVRNTYLKGFCEGIREVLDKQCTALMLLVPKDVEEAYKEHTKDFRKISVKLAVADDEKAYEAGKREGRDTATARSIEG